MAKTMKVMKTMKATQAKRTEKKEGETKKNEDKEKNEANKNVPNDGKWIKDDEIVIRNGRRWRPTPESRQSWLCAQCLGHFSYNCLWNTYSRMVNGVKERTYWCDPCDEDYQKQFKDQGSKAK